MKKFFEKKMSLANTLMSFAVVFGIIAANSRCMCIYHDLPQPKGIEKFKRG